MPKYVSEFDILGEIVKVKDAEADSKIEALSSNVNTQLNNFTKQLNIANDSKLLTVGKKGARFTTINEAINKAISLGVSKTNPITILVYGGIYTEQIVQQDIHGLSIIGCGIDKTIIEFNGAYPNCVMNIRGDITVSNLTIHQLNNSTYAIHVEYVDSDVIGDVVFDSCRIYGGSSAIGFGTGQYSELMIKNCILEGSSSILYGHNSAYNRSGQKLTVLNNLFKHTTEQYCVTFDDAGFSYGSVSTINVVFANNTCDNAAYGKVLFRKNTNDPSTNKTYFPLNDSNVYFGPGNNGNSIKGLNYRGGNIVISTFVTIPSQPDTTGSYIFTLLLPYDLNNYNRNLVDITLPGVGSVTSQFAIGAITDYGINISTNDSSYAGKAMALTLELIVS